MSQKQTAPIINDLRSVDGFSWSRYREIKRHIYGKLAGSKFFWGHSLRRKRTDHGQIGVWPLWNEIGYWHHRSCFLLLKTMLECFHIIRRYLKEVRQIWHCMVHNMATANRLSCDPGNKDRIDSKQYTRTEKDSGVRYQREIRRS